MQIFLFLPIFLLYIALQFILVHTNAVDKKFSMIGIATIGIFYITGTTIYSEAYNFELFFTFPSFLMLAISLIYYFGMKRKKVGNSLLIFHALFAIFVTNYPYIVSKLIRI